jgi:hypothetical protein
MPGATRGAEAAGATGAITPAAGADADAAKGLADAKARTAAVASAARVGRCFIGFP